MTTQTLTDRVLQHWHNVLDVNSSWVEFTNEIGVLNLLYDAGTDDLEWLVELFGDTEQFENEDTLDLLWATQEAASTFKADPDLVTYVDLAYVVSMGFDAADVAEVARQEGVREEEINEFEDNEGLVPA